MADQQPADVQPSHALLPRWANDQDGWPRAIAGDVLKNRVQPADLDIDRYLKLLLVLGKVGGSGSRSDIERRTHTFTRCDGTGEGL